MLVSRGGGACVAVIVDRRAGSAGPFAAVCADEPAC